MAATPLVRFVSPYFFLKYITLNRTVFLASLGVIVMASILVYVAIDRFVPLFIVAVVLGLGLSIALPYVELAALVLVPKESYGKVRLFGSVGFIAISIVLVEFLQNPYNAIHFLVFAALLVALCGWWLSLMVGSQLTQTPDEEIAGVSHFSLGAHGSLWVSLFLMQVAFMPFYNFFFIYETAQGISAAMTVYLWSFGVVCEIVMLYFQGPLFKRFGLVDMLLFSTLLTVVRWMILFLFPDHLGLIAFSQALHAFSFGLYHSAAIRYLYTLYTKRALAQQFFFGISYGLGALVGSIISGVWYEFSPSTIYALAAVITAFSWIALKRHQKL